MQIHLCFLCTLKAPSTKHQAPSTKHQAPSTKHQAPSTKHQAPSTKHQAPSTKHQAPSTKHQAANEEISMIFPTWLFLMVAIVLAIVIGRLGTVLKDRFAQT
ncbi:hypothetical protein [Acinetobacter tibetensis]|uniref:Uncharacterized protein n=1 Tax=Acinetobacter tibetensis TaxID=2943497 RepID=A0AAE9S1I2_9GAMM|nr:hypothetical protein [Acinetobacter tibetensis]USE84906.1 hypothetical protein M5E07_01895 [Acinetobacter tibetensis]